MNINRLLMYCIPRKKSGTDETANELITKLDESINHQKELEINIKQIADQFATDTEGICYTCYLISKFFSHRI